MKDRRNISPEARRAIAQKAAAARWSGLKKPPAPETRPAPAPRRAGREISVEEFCWSLAASFQLPPEYYEKPAGIAADLIANANPVEIAAGRALHIIQLGREVGLPPAQALASISIKYGRPTIGGDAQLAIVLESGKAEYVREYTEGGEIYIEGKINMAHCAVLETLRAGEQLAHFSKFSVEDAHTAELWNSGGTWRTHKPRMLKYRARAFGLRDKYPDILKGLAHSTEEMEGETSISRAMPDISPRNGAAKLSGLLEQNILNIPVTIIEKAFDKESTQ